MRCFLAGNSPLLLYESMNAAQWRIARQTGKTYSIREYGKRYKSFVEINFAENPDAVGLFGKSHGSQEIMFRLSAWTKQELVPGDTLIFFDEVQLCPEIVTSITFLVEEGSYRYILSGSLLGVELRDLRSEPVGYMGVKDMYPLDFEEFCTNLGVNEAIISSLRESWLARQAVDSLVHNKMMELFRLYLIVGGMPAAVNQYLQTNNLQRAGVALPVYNAEESKSPLLLACSRNLFKLFQSDIGLLAAQYAAGIQLRIIQGEADINYGAIYENAVAQELVAHGIPPYYYNNKKRGELDFMIELGGQILPIEVKSGKAYTAHSALNNVLSCDAYRIPEAIVFNNDNLRTAGRIIYAPIYMVMFIQQDDSAPAYYKIDLSALK